MKNRKKLLFVTQDLAVGGGTSSLSSLYSIIKKDYEITVFLLADEGEANVSYRDVILRSKLLTDLYFRNASLTHGIKKYASFLVKSGFKLLHKLFRLDPCKILVVIEGRKLKGYDSVISFGEGVATLFSQHIGYHPRTAWIHYEVSNCPYSEPFFRLYNKFDNIITVSNTIAEKLGLIYPQLASRIIGIHNVIDVERIKNLALNELDTIFSDREFNIISLGRFAEVKRFPSIPMIAKEVKKSGHKIRWRVYGPLGDENELKKFKDNIERFEVGDIVEYCGNRTNPYPYLNKSDLFVMLSSSEACPMVITEARVLDVPIVSTDYTTASEFIENNVDGLIRPLDEIANAIIKLISDKNLLLNLRNNSTMRIQDSQQISKQISAIVTDEN